MGFFDCGDKRARTMLAELGGETVSILVLDLAEFICACDEPDSLIFVQHACGSQSQVRRDELTNIRKGVILYG